MEKLKYVCVAKHSYEGFHEECNSLINDGYKPQGGIFYAETMREYMQAFIKAETQETEPAPPVETKPPAPKKKRVRRTSSGSSNGS